jgi:hypothetical protein
MAISGYVGKEDVVHIHNGILFIHKKNDILSFSAAWMGLDMMIS